MNFLPNGKMQFSDFNEMCFHLFNQIGFGINSQDYLYDQDSGIVLQIKGKFIKASTVPKELYAGKNDIIFDPAHNYNLMNYILGYYLSKMETIQGDMGIISTYVEDDFTKQFQRIVVKTKTGSIESEWYRNTYLGYFEAIFKLGDNFPVDLSNFDELEI